jgi:hypothetical protein
MLAAPMMLAKRDTIRLRSWSVISPVVKCPSVPTISRRKMSGSFTRIE